MQALGRVHHPPPDVIQLACASHARVDLFITNDGAAQHEINSSNPVRQLAEAHILVSAVLGIPRRQPYLKKLVEH